MSSPAHINLLGEVVSEEIAKGEAAATTFQLSKKQSAQNAARTSRKSKVAVGGGH